MILRMHHVGRVVTSISDNYRYYTDFNFQIFSGYETPQIDIHQQVLVGVVDVGNMLIELLEPLSETSPIYTFQQKGGGFHHVCYEVADLVNAIEWVRTKKIARQITEITESVWNNRRIVFFMSSRGEVFELLEGVRV